MARNPKMPEHEGLCGGKTRPMLCSPCSVCVLARAASPRRRAPVSHPHRGTMWLFPAESLTLVSWAQGTPNQSEKKFFCGDSRKEGGNGGGACEVVGVGVGVGGKHYPLSSNTPKELWSWNTKTKTSVLDESRLGGCKSF